MPITKENCMPKLFSTGLLFDIVKIKIPLVFIISGRFFKPEITNFVSFNFASGPEIRLCSEDFGLWLASESAHKNKLKFQMQPKKSIVSRHSKNHNSLDFHHIGTILEA